MSVHAGSPLGSQARLWSGGGQRWIWSARRADQATQLEE